MILSVRSGATRLFAENNPRMQMPHRRGTGGAFPEARNPAGAGQRFGEPSVAQ